MSGSAVMLAVDSAGTGLDRLKLDSAQNLKVDLAASSGGTIAANVDVTGNTIGLATESTLSAMSSAVALDSSITTLTSTVATETTLQSADTSLSSLDTKMPVQGQAAMAASLPVVIASNQSAIPVSQSAGSATSTTVFNAVSVSAGASANSTSVDLNAVASPVSCYGNFGDLSAQIQVQFSSDDVTYYTSGIIEYVDGLSGDFGFTLQGGIGARYVRLRVTNNDVGSQTITGIISYKS